MEEIINALMILEDRAEHGFATHTDFLRLVRKLRKNSQELRKYSDRLGDIDRKIFEKAHRIRLPFWLGFIVEIIGFAAGIAAGVYALGGGNQLLRGVALIAAQVLTVSSFHPISHIMAAWIWNIRFLGFYFNGPLKIEPGVKVEYGSFLRNSPKVRAIFFAAGIFGTLSMAFYWLVVGFAGPYTAVTKIILTAIAASLFFSEFLSVLLPAIGKPKLFGFSWYRGDLYKALRELH